jgi:hypothetical protein
MVDDKVKCDRCGRPFAARYIHTHMRREHNIYGGASGRRRSTAPPKPKSEIVVVPKAPAPNERRFTQLEMVVLEDEQGSIWIAEKIR